MKIPGAAKLGRIVRRVERQIRPRPVILLYHHIAEVSADPWSLCVSPAHFNEQLAILQKNAEPISLQELVGGLVDGKLPKRAVVVTFDDGYADNLYTAKPLLEHYQIPATVFLTTGFVGKQRELWWDELERILLEPGELPERLSLTIAETVYHWELGEAAHYSEAASRHYRQWRGWEAAPGLRQQLYRILWEKLQLLAENERQAVLDRLVEWAAMSKSERPTHRPLSAEELLKLVQGNLIELGVHTVSHPVLSALPASFQEHEITTAKTWLEERLGFCLKSFAYPYGRPNDYTDATIELVREAGFNCACSNFKGVVGLKTDPFQLPRVPVADWNGEKFARRLSRRFDV